MLKIPALALAAASTASSPALLSTAPWGEKVTVKIAGNGKAQSCQYESSLTTGGAQQCDVEEQGSAKASAGSQDELTSITFERRFSPNAKPDTGSMQAGDTLIAGQVMALAIDATGSVRGCHVVASAGETAPDYGCDEAKAERFEASARSGGETPRQAYMTILVYGHSENVA